VRLLAGAAVAATVALTAGSAAATPQGSPPTANPNPNAVFGIGPSNGKTVDGRPYFYFLASPGAVLHDYVAVADIGAKPLSLTVYPSDATNGDDGTFDFPPAAQKSTEVGTWLTLTTPSGTDKLSLHSQRTAFLPFTLRVPADAPPGDHAGALIASVQGEAKNKQGQLVHIDQRIAVRVFIRVAGPLHPRLAIENLHVTYHGTLNPVGSGSAVVTYTVHNVGNVKLGAKQAVDVSGWFGTHASATNPPQVPLLLPGGKVDERVVVTGVFPTFRATATVTLTALALPSDSNPSAGPWSASATFWAIPWTLLLLLILIVLGTLFREWRQRQRARGGKGSGQGDGPGGSGGGGFPEDGDGPTPARADNPREDVSTAGSPS
jgi:hypothetical protein